MPSEAAIKDMLDELSDEQASHCLFYILGYMSVRSWDEFANAVLSWFEFREAKGRPSNERQ